MLLDAHNHSAVDERLIVVPGTRLLPSTSIIAHDLRVRGEFHGPAACGNLLFLDCHHLKRGSQEHPQTRTSQREGVEKAS